METPEVLSKYLEFDFQRTLDNIAEKVVEHNPSHFFVTGTGSSYFVSLAEVHAFEQLAGIPATVHVTSELSAYPPPSLGSDSAWLFNSHSGGTIGDMGAVKVAKKRGALTLAITDIVKSTLARGVDHAIIGPGGPKHELPATRTYAAALYRAILLARKIGVLKGYIRSDGEFKDHLEKIPEVYRECTQDFEAHADKMVQSLMECSAYTVIASGPNVATAHEGALGLSQSRGVPAQGFAVENWLHGPIQTLLPEHCVIAIAAPGPNKQRVLQAAKAAKIIGSRVVLLKPDDEKTEVEADFVIQMRADMPELLTPLYYVAPLWQLGYYFSLEVGHDPDRLSMDQKAFQDAMVLLMKGDQKFGA
ncbi:MAG: SIS domain-containing protein [Anaerolineales bacterium]|jgi:glucosamine--fructose-6-phosphate aminotransferase (isomerizing)